MGLTGSSAFATVCSLTAGTLQSFVRCAVLADTAVFCCSVAASVPCSFGTLSCASLSNSIRFASLPVSILYRSAAWRARVRFCLYADPVRGLVLVGPPTAFLRRGTGVPWVSLLGTHQCALRCQARWHRGRSANPLYFLVLLRGRCRGVLVHSAFTCVLEYLQGRSNHPSDFGHKFVLRSRRPYSGEVDSVVIHGNDVAKICLRFPRLLNFLEFLGFLDILGILALPVSLYGHPVEHPYVILENPTLRRD